MKLSGHQHFTCRDQIQSDHEVTRKYKRSRSETGNALRTYGAVIHTRQITKCYVTNSWYMNLEVLFAATSITTRTTTTMKITAATTITTTTTTTNTTTTTTTSSNSSYSINRRGLILTFWHRSFTFKF